MNPHHYITVKDHTDCFEHIWFSFNLVFFSGIGDAASSECQVSQSFRLMFESMADKTNPDTCLFPVLDLKKTEYPTISNPNTKSSARRWTAPVSCHPTICRLNTEAILDPGRGGLRDTSFGHQVQCLKESFNPGHHRRQLTYFPGGWLTYCTAHCMEHASRTDRDRLLARSRIVAP
jgi:hypothetical protein